MTAATTQETRQLIARFLEAHERADAQAIRELITEDATWHLPPSAGVGPFTGAERVSAALAGSAADNWLDVSTIKRQVTKSSWTATPRWRWSRRPPRRTAASITSMTIAGSSPAVTGWSRRSATSPTLCTPIACSAWTTRPLRRRDSSGPPARPAGSRGWGSTQTESSGLSGSQRFPARHATASQDCAQRKAR